jgi:hypothetical protein
MRPFVSCYYIQDLEQVLVSRYWLQYFFGGGGGGKQQPPHHYT